MSEIKVNQCSASEQTSVKHKEFKTKYIQRSQSFEKENQDNKENQTDNVNQTDKVNVNQTKTDNEKKDAKT